ncbi:cell division cycle 20.1, cofactor of APC complex-like isoform X2 [Helianthus annuus]|nr:cell division cycle 20.1, cofactor of APC complex-like isoform X2 [Helianthus annuus]XP_035835219.1 cell division cycle 20.1, cofactor of APC complex-like isoform X2 [Helianthus annuus]
MDFDYAHCMLTQSKNGKENPIASSPAKEAYRNRLADSLNMNRTRILAFRNKPPTPIDAVPNEWSSVQQAKPVKALRYIPQNANMRVRAKAVVSISQCVSKLESGEIREYGLSSLVQTPAELLKDRLPEAREATQGMVLLVYKAVMEDGENEEEDK